MVEIVALNTHPSPRSIPKDVRRFSEALHRDIAEGLQLLEAALATAQRDGDDDGVLTASAAAHTLREVANLIDWRLARGFE